MLGLCLNVSRTEGKQRWRKLRNKVSAFFTELFESNSRMTQIRYNIAENIQRKLFRVCWQRLALFKHIFF
jgi:hypothetical protein